MSTFSPDGPFGGRHRETAAAAAMSKNERDWIVFLRLAWPEGVPAPTLAMVQAMRLASRDPELFAKLVADGENAANRVMADPKRVTS